MKKRIHLIVLIILSSIIISYFYGNVLLNSNSYLFCEKGDAIKNYYTYFFHIANDTSCIHFQGMNYPYGEHYMYTDCHPFLTNILHFSGKYLPFLYDYSIGIVNVLMIISIFLTFLLVYFLLLEFDIRKWISVLFAIGITLLQPQIFRLTGHLALSYSICIPLTWLLVIKYHKSHFKNKFMVFLLLNNLFWLFTHAYLGMIVIFFQASYSFISVLYNRKAIKQVKTYVSLFFTIIFPLLFFRLFILFTDIHEGRTDNPSGFFLSNAEPDDIVIPHHPPLRPLLDSIPGLNINLKWEAWGYIGFVFSIILILFILLFLTQIFKKKKNTLFKNVTDNIILNISLGSSFMVLLFAFAFPFKMFPTLVDYIPFINQFRATGRFDWVFFYVFSVFAVYVLNKWFNSTYEKGKIIFAYILIGVTGLFTIYEGISYHTEMAYSIKQAKNQFNENYLNNDLKQAIAEVDFSRYQAILPIPFYYIGSESFSRPLNDEVVRLSMVLSAHTTLPLFSAYLTRTSVPESKKIVQLISPSFYPKLIEKDMVNPKPILIIKSNEIASEYEMDVIQKSTLLFKTDSFSLYVITIQKLFENTAKIEIDSFLHLKDSLFVKNEFLVNDTNAFIYYDDYEKVVSDKYFRGKGSFAGTKKGKNIFAQFGPNVFSSDKEYTVSAWMYNGEKDALNLWFRFIVEEYDEVADQFYETIAFPEMSETIYGDWSLIELKFRVNNPRNSVCIVSKGKDDEKARLFLDDLLIRESKTNVYKINESNSVLLKNNHEIKP